MLTLVLKRNDPYLGWYLIFNRYLTFYRHLTFYRCLIIFYFLIKLNFDFY